MLASDVMNKSNSFKTAMLYLIAWALHSRVIKLPIRLHVTRQCGKFRVKRKLIELHAVFAGSVREHFFLQFACSS